MTKIKTFSQEKPLLFSVAVCVVFFAILNTGSYLFSFLPDKLPVNFLKEVVDVAWPVGLTFLFGYGFIFKAKGFGAGLKAGMSLFAFYIFAIGITALKLTLVDHAQWQPLPIILLNIVLFLGIGIREEVIFRGVIVNAIARKYATDKKGLWFTVIMSSLLFGGFHIMNLIHGVEPMGVISQIIGGIGAGLFFVAVYLRSGSIWPTIIIHALQDAAALLQVNFTVSEATDVGFISSVSILEVLIPTVPFILLAMFLLRKSKQPEIFARLEKLRAAEDK